MPADILTRIQNEIHAFSKGQKKIASYILTNYDKAAFMTASRLGKTVEVSESTVVRFAVELGYAGYPEMQKTLQELVRNKLTSVQRIEVASDQFGNQDVVSSVLQRDANAIRMTAEALDRAQMIRAVGAILRARCIYIVGVRSSAALANYLNFYFRNIFENVRLVSSTATSEMFEQLLRVGHEDVVIGISISTGTGRRRNHQFREQPAQLEPVAEHVVRPFEFQQAVRLVRRGTVFLDHAVQGVQRDQSGDHLQPAIDGFVGGDRARNAHGIGHRRATAGLTDPLVTIAATAGGLPVGGHHGHRQFAILVVGQRQRPVANHLYGQRVGRIGFVHGDHMIRDGCSSG